MNQTAFNIIFCGKDELEIVPIVNHLRGKGGNVNKINSFFPSFREHIVSSKKAGIIYISPQMLKSERCMRSNELIMQKIEEGELQPVVSKFANITNIKGYTEYWNATNSELTESVIHFIKMIQCMDTLNYHGRFFDFKTIFTKLKSLQPSAITTLEKTRQVTKLQNYENVLSEYGEQVKDTTETFSNTIDPYHEKEISKSSDDDTHFA